jgi:hypothetical protein
MTWGSLTLCPKVNINAKLIHALNDAAQVMSEDFTQDFIHLRRVRIASQPLTKLALYHAESRLDIRALMIMLHERFLIGAGLSLPASSEEDDR